MQEQKITMDQVREQYPQYDDMDDMELANALHGRFYSDIPLGDFYKSIGFNPQTDAGDNGVYPEANPGYVPGEGADAALVNRVGGPQNMTTEGLQAAGGREENGRWVFPEEATDVPVSLGSGLIKGIGGILDIPGILERNVPGADILLGKPRALTGGGGENFQDTYESAFGKMYEPTTASGNVTETVGEMLPNAFVPGGFATRAASVLVPAATTEGGGFLGRQFDRAQPGDSSLGEQVGRGVGGLAGGLGVGLGASIRGGVPRVLGGATEGVTEQQLQLASALRARAEASGVPLTNAEALQQVTQGGTGLSRVQRVAEGSGNAQLADLISQRPQATQSAIARVLDQIGPSVEPGVLAGQTQEAASGVLNTMRQRVNESARPLYDQLPGQTLSPEDLAALQANPSYTAAQDALLNNPELAALIPGGADDLSTVNRVTTQLRTGAEQARPGIMNPQGNNTLASQRDEAARLADEIASATSPEFRQARQTVATGHEAFVDPLKRGPLGAIATPQTLKADLSAQANELFPAQPFEGTGQETARALDLMGAIDPNVPAPLVRQHLARGAAESTQSNVGGPNAFGGAKFAAQQFGNPLQEANILGAVDRVAPQASPDTRDLIEALRATGQREAAGSNTTFNDMMMNDLRGGDAAQAAVSSATNPLGILKRVSRGLDDMTATSNAERLAEILAGSPEEFARQVLRSRRLPTGTNRARLGITALQSQEE